MMALEKQIRELGHLLKINKLILATAESCTGGGLSYLLTRIAGSSVWFDRGFVTYSNAAKLDMLDVEPLTLEQYGAVSEETAREMAEGALKKSNASISIAITGIAGPGGGTDTKPVGTVWFGLAKKDRATITRVAIFPGDREEVRLAAIETAVNELLNYLK